MKRADIIVAGLAGLLALSLAKPAAAQEMPAIPPGPSGSPISPQAATVYRTGMGGGLFGGSGGAGGTGRDILVGGGITLAAAYVGSVIGGVIALNTIDYDVLIDAPPSYPSDPNGFGAKQATEKLYIPIIGPWMGLMENLDALDRCNEIGFACQPADYWLGNVGFIVAGTAQAVGVALVVYGLLHGGGSSSGSSSARPRARVLLSAGPVPGGGILTAAGSF